jgi:hypothetical protein
MRNYARIAIALLLLSPAASAQSPAAPDPGANLLKTAMDKMDIMAPGTLSYRLQAHVTWKSAQGKTTAGKFTRLFAAPSLWREETEWSDATTIELATHDRIWQSGEDTRRIERMRLDTLLHFYDLLAFANSKTTVPHEKNADGLVARCIKLTLGSFTREVCLDPRSDLPLRIKEATREFALDKADYMPLATKRFPRHLIYREHGRNQVEIFVDALDTLGDVSKDIFAPPPGAHSMPWCPDEKRPRLLRLGGVQAVFLPTTLGALLSAGIPAGTLEQFSLLVFDVAPMET